MLHRVGIEGESGMIVMSLTRVGGSLPKGASLGILGCLLLERGPEWLS